MQIDDIQYCGSKKDENKTKSLLQLEKYRNINLTEWNKFLVEELNKKKSQL